MIPIWFLVLALPILLLFFCFLTGTSRLPQTNFMTEEVDNHTYISRTSRPKRRLLKSCDCSKIESQSTDTGDTSSV